MLPTLVTFLFLGHQTYVHLTVLAVTFLYIAVVLLTLSQIF